MSNPQDDPERGEFSNYGRTGWDLECVLWFVLMVIVSYGIGAAVALALLGLVR